MVKIKLYSAGNFDKYTFIVVEKNKDFFHWLSEFLRGSINFIGLVGEYEYLTRSKNVRTEKKKVSQFKDVHEYYKGLARIDVFYGQKKVFLVLVGGQYEREKFLKAAKDLCKLPRIKTSKPRLISMR